MALSFAEVPGARGVQGTIRETFYDVTLDSSYPTAGYAIGAQNVGLASIFGVELLGQSLTTGAAPTTLYGVSWDQVNGKLQLFQDLAVAAAAPFGEVANATNVATRKLRLRFVGI